MDIKLTPEDKLCGIILEWLDTQQTTALENSAQLFIKNNYEESKIEKERSKVFGDVIGVIVEAHKSLD